MQAGDTNYLELMLRLGLALIAALAAIGGAASTAHADSGVIPDTPQLPWSDPAHATALELLASEVASTIAQRPVRVYCNGQADWDALTSRVGLSPAEVWGYVESPRYWYPSLGTWAESAQYTQLSPQACERLWLFAKAVVKPTKCAATRVITETAQVKVRYRTTIRVRAKQRIKVNGKWITKYVWRKQRVWRTRVEQRQLTRTVNIEPQPCYGGSDASITLQSPTGGWARYGEFAFAIGTLAHESVHLLSLTAGRPVPTSVQEEESRAECWGMQLIPQVATSLGAAPDDAYAIARWYTEVFYPDRRTSAPDYWSSECASDRGLDLTPADGHWP